jgi:hypothetical protein
MRENSAPLFVSENPAMQAMALDMLVTAYGFGQAAGVAGDLARAGYIFAREVYDLQGPGGPLMLLTVSAIALSGMHAFNLVGQYADSVEFGKSVVPDFEALKKETNLPDIYTHMIKALIGLHRIDEASQLLVKAEEDPKHSAHLMRLKKQLEDLTSPATELPTGSGAADNVMTAAEFGALDALIRNGETALMK